GPIHAGPASEEVIPFGGTHGTPSAYQRGRVMPEQAAFSDANKLAAVIQRVGRRGMTAKEARQAAEQEYEQSLTRATMELMARRAARGYTVGPVSGIEKQAYHWGGTMRNKGEAVPDLFKDLAETEGHLKLAPGAFDYEGGGHRFVEDPFTG